MTKIRSIAWIVRIGVNNDVTICVHYVHFEVAAAVGEFHCSRVMYLRVDDGLLLLLVSCLE